MKTCFKEIEFDGVNWIHVSQGTNRWRAVVNTVINTQILQKAHNLYTSWPDN